MKRDPYENAAMWLEYFEATSKERLVLARKEKNEAYAAALGNGPASPEQTPSIVAADARVQTAEVMVEQMSHMRDSLNAHFGRAPVAAINLLNPEEE